MAKAATKTSSMYMRFDPAVRKEVEEIYAQYGMSLTDAINIFIYQSRNVGGLPFDLRPSQPNAETIRVIENIEQGKNVQRFDNAEDMFKDLEI